MRQLLPDTADVDPVTSYLAAVRTAPAGRPWVTVGMIASLDGATAVSGTSGALGGEADKAVFRAVRAIADVILVAAGTVRAEGYQPVRLSDGVRAARTAAGRSPHPPRLAVVTRSLDLDLDGPLFAPEAIAPLVITTVDADDDAVAAVAARTEVRRFGEGSVDLAAALGSLADDGAEVVVSEGGPSLNGALVDADLVDEWCLSIAPAGGRRRQRPLAAAAPPVEHGCSLVSLLTADGVLFGRWIRLSRPATAAGD